MEISVLLFDEFETLDVFGPVEIFGRLSDLYAINFYSLNGGIIKNSHGVGIMTKTLDEISRKFEILLIPGGQGTRKEINNDVLIKDIKELSDRANFVLTVCTGSALLAKTGLLDGKSATSNKRAFSWVITSSEKVLWDKNARWTVDDKYYCSSGVSAGMDMSLGFISDRHGIAIAKKISWEIEYKWIENRDDDTFRVEC